MIAALLLVPVALVGLGLVQGQEPAASLPDPLPIHRLHFPPDKLTQILQQDKAGSLQEMSLNEFESKVQQAAQALQTKASAPQLLKAEYTAQFSRNALVGKGTWTVENPTDRAAILPLKDARLALTGAKVNNLPAVTGLIDGAKDGLLLLPQAGLQTVHFDWSLGGSVTGSEVYFNLKTPLGAVSTLELTLPEELLVEVLGTGNLLVGPTALPNGQRMWHLSFHNKAERGLKIHHIKGPNAIKPLRLIQVQSQQTLWPNHLEAEFDCTIEVLNNVVEDLAFDWDFPATPTKVAWAKVELKDWKLVDLPPDGKGANRKALVIRFNGPTRIDRDNAPPLRISCQVPIAKDQRWSSPGVTLRDAVSLGETLSLHIHPSVQLEQWQPGTFRLVQASHDTAGFDTLVLQHEGGPAKRPSAKVQMQQPQATVQQTVWWQIGRTESTVTAELTYRVNHGKVHQLAVALPNNWGPGWQLQTVEITPKGLARQFVLTREAGQQLLVVELQRGVTSAEKAPLKLRFGFRSPHPGKIDPGLIVDLPRIHAVGPVALEGSLGVSVDPLLQALPVQTSVAATAVDTQGPWENAPLTFFYPYRDIPVNGKVKLLPQHPEFRATCLNEVQFNGGKGELLTRLQLEPVAGAPDTIDLFFPAPLAGPLQLKSNGDLSLQRLHALDVLFPVSILGLKNPLAAASLVGASPQGEYWRIKLAQPLTQKDTLSFSAALKPWAGVAAKGGPCQWEIPAPVVINALRSDGKLKLDGYQLSVSDLEWQGLNLEPDPYALYKSVDRGPWYFHYSPSAASGMAPRLWLKRDPIKSEPDFGGQSFQGWVTQPQNLDAWLTTHVGTDGRLTHQFCFRIKGWNKTTLPVELPQGTALQYVRRQGKWVDPRTEHTETGSLRLELPSDAKKKWQWFEIVYTSDTAVDWLLWTDVSAPEPQLPVPVTLTRIWKLPPGVAPLQQTPPPWFAAENEGDDLPATPFWNDLQPDWTAWQPPARNASASLLVVNSRHLELMSWSVAGVLVLVLWRLVAGLSITWRFRLLIVWAAGMVSALVAMRVALRVAGTWPALAGLAVLLVSFYLRPAGTGRHGRLRTPVAVGTALITFIGLGLLLAPSLAVGQGPGFTVYILGPVGTPPQQQKVLVPAALLEQLKQLSQPANLKTAEAVLVSANYAGAVKDGWAEMKAEFRVFCASAQTVLTVPLKGVQLLADQPSRLEEDTVYPLLAPSGAGYTVAIDGHKDQVVTLTLHFKTRVQSKDELQEFSCVIPRLLDSHLTLNFPSTAQAIKAVSAIGRQLVKDATTTLEADLGTADAGVQTDSLLRVRWLQPGANNKKVDIKVSEFHLADLRPSSTGLVSVFKYSITDGSASKFQILIPDHLHPHGIEVRQPDEKPGPGVLGGLKGWTLPEQPGNRVLEVELEAPVTGTVQLTLNLASTAYRQKDSFSLSLPTPLQVQSTGGLVGYLTSAATLPDASSNMSITKIEPETFAKEWLKLRMANPGSPHHAYRFKRFNPKLPAGLQIHPAINAPQFTQDVQWKLYPNFARVSASLKVEDCFSSTYLEWEVPAGLTVAQVTAESAATPEPLLLRWNATAAGTKKVLQIWLANPNGNATVTLTGWLSQSLKPGTLFSLPRLALGMPAGPCVSSIAVSASQGLTLRPLQAKQLTTTQDSGRVHYHAKQSDYAATLAVDAAPVKPQVQILTVAERQGDTVEITAFVHCTVPVGELQSLTLVGRNWQGGDPQLEATRLKDLVTQSPKGKERTWQLRLIPGTTSQYALKLVGRFPLPPDSHLLMPALDVKDAEVVHNWLAVLGPQLQTSDPKGLAPSDEPSKHLSQFPAQAVQIGQRGKLWEVINNDWRLPLMPNQASVMKDVQVLLAEQTAALVGGTRWVYQADYWLAAPAGTLELTLLKGAQLEAARLDGQDIAPEASGISLKIRLSTPSATHRLSVRWIFPADGPGGAPRSQTPVLRDVDMPPMLFTVRIPPGYQLAPAAAKLTTVTPGAACLVRAAAQLKCTGLLAANTAGAPAGDSSAKLAEAQKAFYWYCAEFSSYARHNPEGATGHGPQGQSLDDWRNQLEAENLELAKKFKFESLRQSAVQKPRLPDNDKLSTSLATGTTICWLLPVGSGQPNIQLTLVEIQDLPLPTMVIQILVVVLFVGLMLSFVPGGEWLARALGPEELFLVGLAGLHFFGATAPAFLTMSVAVVWRLSWLLRHLSRGARRSTAPSGSS